MDDERRKTRVLVEEQIVNDMRAHMATEDEQRTLATRWRFGKEVPLALVMAIAAQTLGVVWAAATLSSRVDNIEKAGLVYQTVQDSVDRRQDADARRSEDRIATQLDKISVKLDRVIEAKGGRQ